MRVQVRSRQREISFIVQAGKMLYFVLEGQTEIGTKTVGLDFMHER